MSISLDYDVVIAGLGVSGLSFVRELSLSDIDARILVLERQPLWSPWDSNTTIGTQDEYALPIARRSGLSAVYAEGTADFVDEWWTSQLAGGGFNRWYGQMSRFQSVDFDGTLGAAWPIQLADIEPWYDVVEQDLLPFGCSYGYLTDEYSRLDCRYYKDRTQTSDFERYSVDNLNSYSLQGYIGQSCLGGRVWERFPVDPQRIALADEHPMLVRANYFVGVMKTLGEDQRFDVVGSADTKRFSCDRGGNKVVYMVDGEIHTVSTRAFVLACGPLNTVPILMRSGLPNRNDRLGRDITFTLERVAYGLLDARRSANDIDTLIGSFSSTVVKTFYTYSESGAASKGGKFSIYDGKNVELAHRRRQQLALAGADVESFLAREAKGQMSIKISWKGESDVSDSKYLSVDSGRTVLHYRPAIADVDRHRAVEAQMNLIAESLLAESLHMQPVPSGADLISAHHHGGAIFSDDPSKAVVSPDGELLEAAGVYVADGSIMPTSGATNSSLTVMANARRIARCLIERLEGS